MFETSELITAVSAPAVSRVFPGRITGVSTDSRSLRPGDAFIALKGDNFDGNDFIADAVAAGARLVLFQGNPGSRARRALRAVTAVCVSDTVKALGDLARFHRRRFAVPVIAVTGSTGKTTTKDMVACCLAGSSGSVLRTEGTHNNHIGLPQTLLKLSSGHRACVVELGSNHPGEIAYLAGICEPTMAVITNVGPSHLEFFGTLGKVLEEKASLLRRLIPPRIAVVPVSLSTHVSRIAKKNNPFIITYGIDAAADFSGRGVHAIPSGIEFTVGGGNVRLSTCGGHNAGNALAAYSCARVLGIAPARIRSALAKFMFPRGRLVLRRVRGIRFLDDSYNSNPASFAASLTALEGFAGAKRRILIMGDMLELGKRAGAFHREAGIRAASVCDMLICVGELSREAAAGAAETGLDRGNIHECPSSEEARDVLFRTVKPDKDDIILLKGSRRMKLERVLE